MPRSCHDDPIVGSNALQNYAIRGPIGRGVWGTVTEAVDHHGRRVAVKELHASLVADPVVRSRFATTAPLLTTIDHPHVVRVVDAIDADGRCVLVSEFMDGGTLRQRASRGVSPEVACGLMLAVASGVDRASRAGLLHRDLKPENVLFTSSGVAEVSDFGLAEIVSGQRTVATRDGIVLGSPAYMAPELVRSEDPRPASDVYALATMLFELLAGRLPFAADGDALSTMARHVREAPADLVAVARGVAPPISGVTMHGLAPEPEDRYASADHFGAALADAAAQAWGPGWLRQTGITVTASEVITERLRATRALEVPTVAETMAAPARSNADETMTAPVVPAAPPTPAAPAPASVPASRGRGPMIAIIAGLVVVVAVALALALTSGGGGGGGGTKLAAVNGKAVTVPGDVAWTDTGVELQKGDDVTITATGTVLPNKADPSLVAGPDGLVNDPGAKRFNVFPDAFHSALIGRVTAAGQIFAVGSNAHFKSASAGQLQLGINDVGVNSNAGAFQATITVKRK